MGILSTLLVLFVAIEHIYFLVLEMFLWTKPVGLRAFGMTKDQAKVAKILAMNMGLYNGFLAAGLFWGLVHPVSTIGHQITLFFLILAIIAGIFGSFTANRKILYIQAFPALVALVSLNLELVFRTINYTNV